MKSCAPCSGARSARFSWSQSRERGGELVPPLDFLRMLRAVCDTHRVLLILDEIYTGFNRTGALFACEHFGVVPDIVCLGKALTGGFPLSACVGRSDIMDAWPLSTGEALHTSTFLGNPLGCAMALASLGEHAKPETAAHVRERGRKLKASLRAVESKHIADVAALGCYRGWSLSWMASSTESSNARCRTGCCCSKSGPAGNVLVFAPPFAVSDDEIAFSTARLQEYLTSFPPGSIS